PVGSAAKVTNLSSSVTSGSEIVSARKSSNDKAASAKSTLCFARFAAALAGSHSNPSMEPIVCTFVHRRQDQIRDSDLPVLAIRAGCACKVTLARGYPYAVVVP